jgi:hypothetical protein
MANHPTPYHTITTIIVIDHDGEDISILSNTEYGPYEDYQANMEEDADMEVNNQDMDIKPQMDDFKYYIKPEVNVDEDIKPTLIPEQYDILAGEVALRNALFTNQPSNFRLSPLMWWGLYSRGLGGLGEGL